jgi:hypothetical protein
MLPIIVSPLTVPLNEIRDYHPNMYTLRNFTWSPRCSHYFQIAKSPWGTLEPVSILFLNEKLVLAFTGEKINGNVPTPLMFATGGVISFNFATLSDKLHEPSATTLSFTGLHQSMMR